MSSTEGLSESLEDYLEVILALQTTQTVARSKEIARKMDIQRGSVTGMLKKLAAQGLIHYEPYGYVTLTLAGEKIAREIESRHIFLKDFLFRLVGVTEQTADETACRMEHAMNRPTFKKFKAFVSLVDACPHCSTKRASQEGIHGE